MIQSLLATTVGKLRIITFLEGISLLLLLFICMPLKYLCDMPMYTKIMGSVHGGLFVLFVIYVWQVADEYDWKFWSTTLKVLISSFIPFGTFYIDKTVLSKLSK